MDRRRFLALSAATVAGCSSPTETNTTGDGGATRTTTRTTNRDGVRAETVASGFAAPLGVIADGDALLVADQVGVVYRATGDGKQSVLDLRDRIVPLSGYEERGLLGIALRDDTLYVRYSAPRRAGTPENYDHTFVLSAFDRDGDGFDPASERTILEIPEPQANHNAGDLAFGPDGYLYVGVGDGGGANDQGNGHVDDWYDANPGGNGQDVTENLLGSIVRIDVSTAPYSVPDDNPLVGREGLDELYAWGLRNPWRFSFDEGDFYAADVGQSSWEEVNLVEKGGNYGWNVREGKHCFRQSSCPTETPDGAPLVDPVIEYPHSGRDVSGIAVIGGYVYRGTALDAWRGEYVFADWNPKGRVFVATPGEWTTRPEPVDGLGAHVLAFGRDSAGELLACTTERTTPSGETGRVVRFVPA